MHAKSILFLSHTDATCRYIKAGMGEIANAAKLQRLMTKAGYATMPIVDIFEIFGGLEELYCPLADLNYDLAAQGHEIVQHIGWEDALKVRAVIDAHRPDLLFLLSWSSSLASLFALGLALRYPTASKLYVSHEEEIVKAPLYAPSSLLLTESMLASSLGVEHGIPAWKIIHLPHHYPIETEHLTKNRTYIEHLAAVHKKTITRNTVILGSISRLSFGKNCEYAIDAAAQLHLEGADILFVLKGELELFEPYAPYRRWLEEKLKALQEESWFIWDRERTAFPEILQTFASLDVFLHLSGAEAGSNVIVEALALGLPSVILDASTNPSLFRSAALFVKHTSCLREALVPFYIPDSEDLLTQLRPLVADRFLREEWAQKAKSIAQQRFHPAISQERFSLITEATLAYYHKTAAADDLKKKVEELFLRDVHRYS